MPSHLNGRTHLREASKVALHAPRLDLNGVRANPRREVRSSDLVLVYSSCGSQREECIYFYVM